MAIAVLGFSLASYYLPKYYPSSEPPIPFLSPIYYGEFTSSNTWNTYVLLMNRNGITITAMPIHDLLLINAIYAATLAIIIYVAINQKLKLLGA